MKGSLLKLEFICSDCSFAEATSFLTAHYRLPAIRYVLDYNQLCPQSACLFQRFKDRDQVAWCGTDLIHRAHDLIEIYAGTEYEHAGGRLIDRNIRARYRLSLALGKRGGLAHIRSLRDGDG